MVRNGRCSGADGAALHRDDLPSDVCVSLGRPDPRDAPDVGPFGRAAGDADGAVAWGRPAVDRAAAAYCDPDRRSAVVCGRGHQVCAGRAPASRLSQRSGVSTRSAGDFAPGDAAGCVDGPARSARTSERHGTARGNDWPRIPRCPPPGGDTTGGGGLTPGPATTGGGGTAVPAGRGCHGGVSV